MGRFDGKVVFVTGGARGQGRQHALAFAEEGADIAFCDIASQVETVPYKMSTEDQLEETVRLVEDLDRRCVGLKADCRDTRQVNEAVETAVAELGRIDVLLANHGILSLGPVVEMSDEQWNDVLDTDLTGVQGDAGRPAAHAPPELRADRGDGVDGRPHRAADGGALLRGQVGRDRAGQVGRP